MTNLSPINGSLRSTGRYAAISWVELTVKDEVAITGTAALAESVKDVFAITGTTRSTYLRPNSDITVGAWTPSTGSTLYGVLDETVADSSDFIEAQTISSCEVKLSPAGTPLVKTNHILKYQLLSGIGSITVKLVQGASVIKSWTHTLTVSDQLIASELSEAEAETITNYADLRVRFET